VATEVLSAIVTTATWNSWTQAQRDVYGATRQYSDLTSWASAIQNTDWITTDQQPVAEIYDDFGAGLSINNINFNGLLADQLTHYPIVRAASGQEYNALTGVGAKLINTGVYYFLTYSTKLDLHQLHISNPTNSNQYLDNSRQVNTYNCFLDNVRFYSSSTSYEAVNTVNIARTVGDCFGALTTKNCTAIGKGGGVISGKILYNSCIATNCIGYNEIPTTDYNIFWNTTTTTCAQNNNGSASLGAGNIDNLLTTDFTDYANGDYSVATGSQLIDAGTDLSVQFTTDIVGTVRG